VFVVGHLRDWRAAAAVLFERNSLSGDSAPSREKRKEVAASVGDGTPVGGLCARTGLSISVQDAGQGHLLPIALQDITAREKAQNGKGWNDDGSAYTVDTHATQGVAQPIPLGYSIREDAKANTFSATELNVSTALKALQPGVQSHHAQTFVAQPICLMDQGGSVMNIEHDMSGTLRRETHGHEPIVMQQVGAFKPGQSAQAHSIGYENEMAPTLEAGSGGNNKPAVHHGMAVRRLTPVECERLQGFPDNYTDIQPKGKATPDGPRYKALGNSMAVPVMAWIGKRIQEVEQMQCKPNK
jgi:DNA (cytosine-5)-methyltransferase 1